jgi:hypothetical protein
MPQRPTARHAASRPDARPRTAADLRWYPAGHAWRRGAVAEAIGTGIPLVAMPCLNAAYARHPQFDRSIGELRLSAVRVLYGDNGFVPNQPNQEAPTAYPWHLALNAANAANAALS